MKGRKGKEDRKGRKDRKGIGGDNLPRTPIICGTNPGGSVPQIFGGTEKIYPSAYLTFSACASQLSVISCASISETIFLCCNFLNNIE